MLLIVFSVGVLHFNPMKLFLNLYGHTWQATKIVYTFWSLVKLFVQQEDCFQSGFRKVPECFITH